MARLSNFWRRLTGWWARSNRRLLLVALPIVILAVLYFLVEAGYAYPWTGFGEYTPRQPKVEGYQREKTTWDWLQLLIIPIVLAVGGLLFTWYENREARRLQERREKEAQKLEDQRIQEARKIEEQRAQDASLQAYLDQMTELLLHEKLRTSQPDDEVRSVARARTLTVLRVLDGTRKATVLEFLYEAGLVGGFEKDEQGLPVPSQVIDTVVSLSGADLSETDLREAYLEGVNLYGAYLVAADLDGAHLDWANLSRANLSRASLIGAHLCSASMAGADLFQARFIRADLREAELVEADLRGGRLLRADLRWSDLSGTDLSGADLTNCKVTPEQPAKAHSLEGAKLPFDMTPPPAPEVKVAAPQDGQSQPEASQHADSEHE